MCTMTRRVSVLIRATLGCALTFAGSGVHAQELPRVTAFEKSAAPRLFITIVWRTGTPNKRSSSFGWGTTTRPMKLDYLRLRPAGPRTPEFHR